MKNRNIQLTAMLFVVALAIAPILQAAAQSDGAAATNMESEQDQMITIHSTDNVTRGKTAAFVLNMKSADIKPAVMLGGMYVKFSVSGTAIPGVDYVALVSPAYIGQSGYAVLLVKALPDPRASSNRQAYSVVVTLEPGPGYTLGKPSSATMWIKP